MTTRRRFLTALTAAGAASLTPNAFGQSRAVKLNVRGGAIDVHHHFVPPGGATNRPWSPEMSLEQMDKFGIAVAILSMTQNGELLYNGGAKGRSAVRAGNEYGAELMQRYPKRFGLMGGIPMPDVEGSLREVEYAYDVLKVDAIGIYTNDNQGRWHDYSPEPIESTVDPLPALKLSRAFEQMMLRGNAERLFPRFKVK
jgi:6-methylsalicylate decarboxylase